MALRLITESVARREWAGDMMVVREDRNLKSDIVLFLSYTAIALLVLLPFWRPDVPVIRDISYSYALFAAVLLFAYAYYISADLKAARAPASWLLAASRERIWVQFRSYKHYQWPRTDPTVFALERSDIDSIFGVKIPRNNEPQMAIKLVEKIPHEMIDILMDENTRLEGNGFLRGRHNHEPVRIEKDERTLRLMFKTNLPTLAFALDKLRLNYDIDPPRSIPEPEAYLLPNEMPLTDAVMAEAHALVAQGKKLEAIRYLTRRTGISLRDCKAIIDDLEQGQYASQQGAPE